MFSGEPQGFRPRQNQWLSPGPGSFGFVEGVVLAGPGSDLGGPLGMGGSAGVSFAPSSLNLASIPSSRLLCSVPKLLKNFEKISSSSLFVAPCCWFVSLFSPIVFASLSRPPIPVSFRVLLLLLDFLQSAIHIGILPLLIARKLFGGLLF